MRWDGLLFIWVISALTALSSRALPIPYNYQPCILTYCPSRFTIFPPRSSTPTPTNPLRTNAQRLANGVPLKPPDLRPTKTGPFKRTYESSRPRPSPLPKIEHCGIISVKNETGHCVGYIDKKSHHSGQIFVTDDVAHAVKAKYVSKAHEGRTGNASIWLKDWSESEHFPLLGLVMADEDTSTIISPTTPAVLVFAGVEHPGSRPGEVPTFLNDSYSFATEEKLASETRLWSIDHDTGLIEAEWVNSDESTDKPHFFGVEGALYASGNPDLWVENTGLKIDRYTLHFVETDD